MEKIRDENVCSEHEKEDKEYGRLLKERDMLFENQKEQSNLFDKNILYISAGAFAITPIYLEKFFQLNVACGLKLIYVSMLLFGIAIVSTLWAFFAAARCSKTYLEQLDKCWREKGKIIECYNSCWEKCAKIFNWISVCTFSLAMLLVFLFFIIN